MELPDYVRRADKSPPPSAPTGGALSGAEHDHNLDESERVFSEIDAEFVKKADAVPLDPENPAHIKTVTVANDMLPVMDSEAEEEGTTKLTSKANLLAEVNDAIDDVTDELVDLGADVAALQDQIGDIETILASI